MKKIQVYPSVLSFDFQNIARELERMKACGLTTLHYDAMDGHFTRNISFGESLYPSLVPDGFQANVHLMITNPLLHTKFFFQMGAESVLVHYEAVEAYLEDFLKAQEGWRRGRKLGIAVNPDTPLDKVFPHLPSFDIVMLMTVFPGSSGQRFLPGSLERIARVRRYLDEKRIPALLEVDGGLDEESGPLAVQAGADILVSGSFLCRASNPFQAVERLLGTREGRGEGVL